MTESFLLTHEPWIRLGCFATGLGLMAIWESLAPRRPRSLSRFRRWPGNLGVVVVSALLLRILVPVAAVGLAAIAERQGFGLLALAGAPPWLGFVLALLALDLAIYAQHVAFHAVPLLWRLHRMHHADLDIDATTGLRFHPLEIVASTAWKLAVVAALGPPPVAVLVFEITLNAAAMFNHANLRLPAAADRMLRLVVVTPDMHRVHHSVVRRERDSNFGFSLSGWDRMFGTYRAQPAEGHAGMTIGLDSFRDPGEQRLDRLLTQPFRGGHPVA